MSVRLVFNSVWKNPGNRERRFRRLARAAAWQFQKRVVAKPKTIQLPNGALFNAYPDCVVSSALIYADWPEFHELRLVRQVLKTNDVIIDVGANVGHISLLLSDLADPTNIFAFEPTPVSFRRLTENWELNRWPTKNLFQKAVGRTPGSVRVPDTASPETKNRISSSNDPSPTVEVPLIRLDDCRSCWRGRRLGLLKIDVEGYET